MFLILFGVSSILNRCDFVLCSWLFTTSIFYIFLRFKVDIELMINLIKTEVSVYPGMSCIPQGCFAAAKCRQRLNNSFTNDHEEYFKNKDILEKTNEFVNDKPLDLLPQRYNSKMMNSIWGLYNRYSVHNVKQHTDKYCTFPEGETMLSLT